MCKIYTTKGNLGDYFQVHISEDKNKVTVFPFKSDEKFDLSLDRSRKFTYYFENVWIGKSKKSPMTKFSGGYGKKWDGNSILLKTTDGKYIQIGDAIRCFCAKFPIVSYHSPVGNNGVVYPYAIDCNGRYYLIFENVVIENIPEEFTDDPYDYYYNYRILAPSGKAKIYTGISSVKFNGIYFHYEPEPKNHYIWLSKKRTPNFWIKMKGQKKEILTKDLYTDIIKSFGNTLGFSSMKSKILANVNF